MSLLDEITLTDLDEKQRELAECIGMEAYKKLVSTYAGENICVRMPDRLTIALRNDRIRQDYNGYNIRYLSRKYGLHESTIRRILKNQ